MLMRKDLQEGRNIANRLIDDIIHLGMAPYLSGWHRVLILAFLVGNALIYFWSLWSRWVEE